MKQSFLDNWRASRDTRVKDAINDGRVPTREELPGNVDSGVGVPVSRANGPVVEAEDRRIYAATYRNKHKEHINKLRRDNEQEPLGAYKKAKRRAKYKKQGWDITFDNWMAVWNACPKVFDDTVGVYRFAWQMRSGNSQLGTQMRRLDTNLGWLATNVEIIYRNQPIPKHGIVALWDYTRDEPTIPEWELRANENGRVCIKRDETGSIFIDAPEEMLLHEKDES